jgi:hypothetical protein
LLVLTAVVKIICTSVVTSSHDVVSSNHLDLVHPSIWVLIDWISFVTSTVAWIMWIFKYSSYSSNCNA